MGSSPVFTPACAAEPSFDCSKARKGAEGIVCTDDELAALDQKLSEVYATALKMYKESALESEVKLLKAEQRGWIKGRDECWKAQNERDCVEFDYRSRIAELQAGFGLAPSNGPVFYVCDGNPANEVVATFFETNPPTARLERGDSQVIAYLTPSGSGAKYEGRNVTFWSKGKEAAVTWGWNTEEMRCLERQAR
ncbi:MAG: MliC family protein [Pseudomonadota bacterium]|nr:MliC family protein [Pseudomonadota bacterium]